MKRLCVFCIALFVLMMAVPVLATETRVWTMGNQYLFIQDDYNIWTYTSTVNNYPRHLIVDHGNQQSETFAGDFARVGMLVPFTRNGVLGAFVSEDSWGLMGATYDAHQRIDLFYGYRASNFDLGLHVDWWGYKEEAGTDETSSSVAGLQAGVGFNANGNMLELDAFYKVLNYTTEVGGVIDSAATDDGGSYLGFAGRYLWAYNNMVTLVPAVAVSQYKEKVLAGMEGKFTMFDVGIGCNTVPLQGTEFLTSVGVDYTKYEEDDADPATDDSTTTWTGLPYVKFGADIQVKNWLNFRVGAQKYVQVSAKDETDPALVQKVNGPYFNYMLGVGIMVGDVQFDCELNQNWLTEGPYFLSGEESSGDMFPWISFKYDFR